MINPASISTRTLTVPTWMNILASVNVDCIFIHPLPWNPSLKPASVYLVKKKKEKEIRFQDLHRLFDLVKKLPFFLFFCYLLDCTDPDEPLLTTDVPTIIGVGVGLSVFSALTCLVLKLFSRARFSPARAYGDANLAPPSPLPGNLFSPVTAPKGAKSMAILTHMH